MKKSDKKTEDKPEEVKSEQTAPVEDEAPAEEVKEEAAAPAEQPEETVAAEEAAEEVKEEKSDKKSFFSSKRNIAIVACAGAAAVALSLGLGLGLGLNKDDDSDKTGDEKTAFNTPTLTISGSMLSWNDYQDATSYTIKFDESNKTLSVTVNSYDLLSDTSYLSANDNNISVMVNATETYLASEYSNKVKYTYNVTVKEDLLTPVVTVSETGLASWDAVEHATGYILKINGEEAAAPTTELNKQLNANDTIQVKAVAEGYNDSPFSPVKKYALTPFDTPDGLTISGEKILSWNAVTGATGYTVKFVKGEEERILSVTGTSVDLNGEEALTKLFNGENVISVKANAAGNKLDSEYSSTVTYTLTLSSEEAAQRYITAVENLATLTSDMTKAQADAINEALATAESLYNNLSEEAKAVDGVSEAKSAYDTKKAAYDSAILTATTAYNEFNAAITAAQAEQTKAEDLALFTEKVTAVTEKKAAIQQNNKLAFSMITADDNGKVTALSAAVTEWTENKNEKLAELKAATYNNENTDKDVAAAFIVKAEAALEGYDELPAYVKNDAEIVSEKTRLNSSLDAANKTVAIAEELAKWQSVQLESGATDGQAEEFIAAAQPLVDSYENLASYVQNGIKDEYDRVSECLVTAKNLIKATVDAVIAEMATGEGADKVVWAHTEEQVRAMTKATAAEILETVEELNGAIENFGAYALTLWNVKPEGNDLTYPEILIKEQDVINNTVVAENDDAFVLASNENDGKVVIVYEAKNVLGNNIAFKTAPTFTFTAGESAVDNAVLECNANNSYIYTYDYTPSNGVSYKYTINGGEEKGKNYTEIKDGIYFNGGGDTVNNAFNETDGVKKISFSGADNTAYFDIYRKEDIDRDGEKDLPVISGLPLVKGIEVKNAITEEEFRAQLARDEKTKWLIGENYEVRFVVYTETHNEDGSYSTCYIKKSLVSADTYVLDLTEDDTKIKLDFRPGVGFTVKEDGTLDTHADGTISLAASNYPEELIAAQFEDSNITKDNVKDYLRFIITVKTGNSEAEFYVNINDGNPLAGSVLKLKIYNALKAVDDGFTGEDIDRYTVTLTLALREDVDKKYSDILKNSVTSQEFIWAHEVSVADTKLSMTLGTNIVNLDENATGKPTGDYQYGRWEVVTDNGEYSDGLTMYVFEVTNEHGKDYDFRNNNVKPFATYLQTSEAVIKWDDVNREIGKAWNSNDKDTERTFVYALCIVPNEKGIAAGFSSSDFVYVMKGNGANVSRADLKYTTSDFRLAINKQPAPKIADKEENVSGVFDGVGDYFGGATVDGKEINKESYGLSVFAYDVTDMTSEDIQKTDFTEWELTDNRVFETYVRKVADGDGVGVDWLNIKAGLNKLWKESPVVAQLNGERQFVFALRRMVKDGDYATYGCLDSEAVYMVSNTDESLRAVVTFGERSWYTPNGAQIGFEPAAINFIRANQPVDGAGHIFDAKDGEDTYGGISKYGVDYIELQFTTSDWDTEADVKTIYMYRDGNDLKLAKGSVSDGKLTLDKENAKICEGGYTNAYLFFDGFVSWVAETYSVTDFTAENITNGSIIFRTRIHNADNGKEGAYWIGEYGRYSSDLKAN